MEMIYCFKDFLSGVKCYKVVLFLNVSYLSVKIGFHMYWCGMRTQLAAASCGRVLFDFMCAGCCSAFC